MADESGITLPYRTNADDIFKFLRILGHGKSFDQIRTMGFSGKNFVGTVLALRELGLAEPDAEKLTEAGRQLTLADNEQRKANILRQQILKYAPYADLLEARLHQGEEPVTKLDWLAVWWAQAGIGTSPNNRSEGALTFADLLEKVGLGTFVRGRRGHASRIEWAAGAFAQIEKWLYNSSAGAEQGKSKPSDFAAPEDAAETTPASRDDQAPRRLTRGVGDQVDTARLSKEPMTRDENSDYYELSLPLGGGRSVYVRVPHQISLREKERMIGMLDLMLDAQEPDSHYQAEKAASAVGEG